VSLSTVLLLDLNRKIYGTIEAWRDRPIEGGHRRGHREILGICEGSRKTRRAGAHSSRGVRLIISDACLGLAENAAEFFPEAAGQRCIVRFLVPSTKVREIATMLRRSTLVEFAQE